MDINDSFEAVKEILSKTFNIPTHNLNGVDRLKQRWKRNKKWMLPFFGESGRIEAKINLVEEHLTKSDLLVMGQELHSYMAKLSEKEKYSKIWTSSVSSRMINLIDKFTPEEILNNRILTTSVYYPGTNKQVPYNTKISKYLSMLPLTKFGYYFSLSDKEEELIRDFINVGFSIFVASLNTSATIILSINPIDFLLVSTHTTGWKSCHDFATGGYKTGGLSYMCDDKSVVAYAYSNPAIIENTNIMWPVKKWRQMVFLDKENLCAAHSRQYPNLNDIYEKKARRLSAKILSDYSKSEYKWYVKSGNKGFDEESDLSFRNVDIKRRSEYHYVDAISSSLRLKDGQLSFEIEVGARTIPCIICGKARKDKSHGALICRDCWR